MQTSCILSIIGLVLDMGGVVLMFFFGISPMINSDGREYITTVEPKKNVIRKARNYKLLSKIGLLLVFLGFSLQLIGYLTSCNNS